MDGHHPTSPGQPGAHRQLAAVGPPLTSNPPVSNDKTENSGRDHTTEPSAMPLSSSTPLLAVNKTTSGHASTGPMVSLRGFMTVSDFEQHQVESNPPSVAVAVIVQFTHQDMRSSQSGTTATPRLQLCLGKRLLTTTVTALPAPSTAGLPRDTLDASKEESPKLFRLLANIIPSEVPKVSSNKLFIQALLDRETIIDSIHFAYYTPPANVKPSASSNASDATTVVPGGNRVGKREREVDTPAPGTDGDGDGDGARSKLRKHAPSEPSGIQDETASRVGDGPRQRPKGTPASSTARRPVSPPPPMENELSCEQTTMRPTSKKPDTIIRTSQIRAKTKGPGEQSKIRLRMNHDLNEVAFGWNPDEYAERRRLIQFWRRQRGQDIQLCYKPIETNQFVEGTNVVSCIFREETDECYITSVDLIGLLECLIGNRFSTEEKNRVRRNLEGFKPETMSKTKADEDSQAFFSLIMGFGEPRPRNIEKDVKVFKWKIVHQAMLKILSKYSYFRSQDLVTSVKEGGESSSSDDEFDDCPVGGAKMEDDQHSYAGPSFGRALRSSTARRGGQAKDWPSSPPVAFQSLQGAVTPKNERSPTPVIKSVAVVGSRAPRLSLNMPQDIQMKRDHKNADLSLSGSTGSVPNTSGLGNTTTLSAARAIAGLYSGQLALSTLATLVPPESSAAASPSLSCALDAPPIMDDRDVNEFLYDATAYMRDPDEAATQATDSPPSFDDASGELDGINGRSFQHQMQRRMQRERLDADMAARRRRPEPLPTQFLSLPVQQNRTQQQQHPPPLHATQLQHPQVHVAQVPFSHPGPAVQISRGESSLAHALDESHIRHATPTNSSHQPQASWEHPLLYPPQPTPPLPQTLDMNSRVYGGSPVQAPDLHPQTASASLVKAEQTWDEDDPNDYLLRASEQAGYNMPALSYDAPPSEWVTLPSPVPYPYPSDHME